MIILQIIYEFVPISVSFVNMMSIGNSFGNVNTYIKWDIFWDILGKKHV